MNPEDEPTAEELREAEELRAALEGRGGSGVEDALGSAALLRHATGRFDLDPAERDRIIDEALAEARPPEVTSWWERLRPHAWLAFAAVGTTALVLLVMRPAPRATALPAPSPELLRAQARALSGDDDAPLDREMDAYRERVYATLSERYR